MTASLDHSSQRCGHRRQRLGWRRILVIAAGAFALLGTQAGNAQELKQSGKVSIEQVQIAFIGSGNLGGGTLDFGGRRYPFSIGGLGVGGFGVSQIRAYGPVYNLTEVAYFPGAYVQLRAGGAVGDVSAGGLWLRNANGVVLHLNAEREGFALSLGGDAIYIKLD